MHIESSQVMKLNGAGGMEIQFSMSIQGIITSM